MSFLSFSQNPSIEGGSSLLRTVGACIIVMTATLLTGCAGGGEGAPAVSSSPSAAGATASLAWDPVQDPTVTGYYVHYGTQSSGQTGSCSYQHSQFVSSPSATISDLAHNTQYYFAVSAYNGLESPCSSEVVTTTPI